jgi:hypothetical protein
VEPIPDLKRATEALAVSPGKLPSILINFGESSQVFAGNFYREEESSHQQFLLAGAILKWLSISGMTEMRTFPRTYLKKTEIFQ